MSEAASAAPTFTRAAGSAKNERRLLRLATGGILFALTAAVLIFRFLRLNELPPGLYFDGGANGLDALQALQGKRAVFFPEKSNGREGLGIYLVALAISIVGRTELAVRLPTALASAGAVFAVFWLGRLLFERDEESGGAAPWRGLLIGGTAAGLMAVSLGQTVLGRTAFRIQLLPLFLTLCLTLLWWAWRRRGGRGGGWWEVALAGACGGLVAYTYTPARFTPFLFLFFGLSFALPFRRSARAAAGGDKDPPTPSSFLPSPLGEALPWAAVFVGAACLVAAPLIVYFALNPQHFLMRADQLWIFDPNRSQGNPLGAFLGNAWGHLLAFGARGDQNWRHNVPGHPLLNPGEAFFFWLGAAMAARRWSQRPAYRLLLIWLGALMLPALLALDRVPAPNTVRMIGALPAVYLLIGVGVWETFRFLKGRLWRDDETRTALAAAVVVSCLVLAQGARAYRAYFHKWAAAPELTEAYETIWTDLARALNAQPATTDTVYLVGLISDFAWHFQTDMHYSFAYLYRGAAPARIVHAISPSNLAPQIQATLAALEGVSTVKYVDWNDDLVGGNPEADPQVALLLGKYGRYLNREQYDGFQIHTYTDIDLDRAWTFYENLEPLTVHYDGGISLNGLALTQGEEQLPSRRMPVLGGDRSLWVVLAWQTAPGLDIDYAISLRLHDAAGRRVYQRDAALGNERAAPTSRWPRDKAVAILYFLDVPADLAPGAYELRMVVYDVETLTPTVEIGVWEAETTLARLRLGEVD